MDTFRLTRKQYSTNKMPLIRLDSETYLKLARLRNETGLPFGALVEACVNFALERLELVDADDETEEVVVDANP